MISKPDVLAYTRAKLTLSCLLKTECAIRAMPTFHFYKGGVKVEEMMGADQNKLVELIAKLK